MSLLQAARAITKRGLPSSSRTFSLSTRSSSAAPADPDTPAASSSSPPPEPAPTPAEDAAESVVQEPVLDPDSSKGGKGYRAWLAGDGAQFRNGLKGKTNWLGDTVSCLTCVDGMGSAVGGKALLGVVKVLRGWQSRPQLLEGNRSSFLDSRPSENELRSSSQALTTLFPALTGVAKLRRFGGAHAPYQVGRPSSTSPSSNH